MASEGIFLVSVFIEWIFATGRNDGGDEKDIRDTPNKMMVLSATEVCWRRNRSFVPIFICPFFPPSCLFIAYVSNPDEMTPKNRAHLKI